jgi:phospholipid/cholesterol/gamma-HCH transport system substrate-binding protein
MEKETVTSIKVGLFVMLGAVCLVLGIYFIGNKKNLFSENIRIRALFSNVGGLQRGNNVRFSGINVGTVKEIVIVNDSTVEVNMMIDKNAAAFIYADALVSIGTDGLMGSRLINIETGPVSSRRVKDGDIIIGIESVQVDDMLQVLKRTNENVSGITADLKKITNEIGSGKGPVWKLLSDTVLSKKLDAVLANLESATEHTERMSIGMANIVDDVKHGKGSLGRLLSDTVLEQQLGKSVSNLNVITRDLSYVSGRMRQPDGVMGTLLSDTAAGQRLQKSLENIEL